MGRLIPAGTGFAYHEKRAARKAGAEVELSMTADEAAAAITEALNAETEMPQTDEE